MNIYWLPNDKFTSDKISYMNGAVTCLLSKLVFKELTKLTSKLTKSFYCVYKTGRNNNTARLFCILLSIYFLEYRHEGSQQLENVCLMR